ncbi:MAG: D-alanine--D-alanine ligase [Elusimicrobia bacterium]|nr:D-alanine--D-alanine ligase [Elusimicrobiota bacterium]
MKSGIGKVLLLTGGDSAERDISLATAENIRAALLEMGIEHVTLHAEGDFIGGVIKENPDVVFIAMHGGSGENGCIQAVLEYAGITYTGSGVLASAVCMNKDVSKKIFEFHKIRTPSWQLIGSAAELKIGLPVVIKPVAGGSTIAVTIVREKSALQKAVSEALEASDDPDSAGRVMAEKYIPGREMTVGIIDGKALPLLEIISKTDFYDYKAKYEPGMSEHGEPRDIPEKLYKGMQEAAQKAFAAAGCRGVGRVDFRLNGNAYYILEINTIPGMTKTSLLPEAAGIAGIDFNTLITRILQSAKNKAKKK